MRGLGGATKRDLPRPCLRNLKCLNKEAADKNRHPRDWVRMVSEKPKSSLRIAFARSSGKPS